MIRCKEVAKLVSSDQLGSQGLLKRAEVLLHLWMCRYCWRWARQIKQLGRAARQLAAGSDAEPAGEGGEELEARLLRKLSDKRH